MIGMSYKALHHSYDAYEHAIHRILHDHQYDFLQDKTNRICAIFGVDVSLGQLYCTQIVKEYPEYGKAIARGMYRDSIDKFIVLGKQETFLS